MLLAADSTAALRPRSAAELPDDVLLHVLKLLPAKGLLAFASTGRAQWAFVHSPRHDEALWKELYARQFALGPEHPAAGGGVAGRLAGLELRHVNLHTEQRFRPSDWRGEVLANLKLVPDRCVQSVENCHRDEIWNAMWSPDGRWLMAGSKDATFSLHRLVVVVGADGREVPQLKLAQVGVVNGPVHCIDWSPDSQLALLTCTTQTVECYDVSRLRLLATPQDCQPYDCAARWCSNTEFICGGAHARMYTWHEVQRFKVVCDEGGELAMVKVDAAKVRNPRPGQLVHPRLLRATDGGTFMLYSTGGLYTAQHWRLGITPLDHAALTHAGGGDGLRLPPAEECVVAAGDGAAPSALLQELRPRLVDETGSIVGLAVPSGGRHVLVNVRKFVDGGVGDPTGYVEQPISTEMSAHLWGIEEGRILHTYHGHKGYSTDDVFLSWPDFSRFSPHIATGSEDGGVYVYNVNHEDGVTLRGHTALVSTAAWHPKLPALIASASDDVSIRLWGTADQAALLGGLADCADFWRSLPRC